MTRVCAVSVLLLVWASGARAQESVVAGQPYTAVAEHPGSLATGFRLYVNGAQVGADLPVTGLVRTPGTGNCAGIWTIGPAGEILRDGKHPGGGFGSEVRCVSNAVWALGSDGMWWRLVSGTWQLQSTVPSGGTVLHLGEIRLPVTFTAGVHSLEVVAFNATTVAKGTALSVTAVAPPPTLKPPTNLRLGVSL